MVENLFVMERLGRERVEDYMREAEQQRLQRALTESPRPAPRSSLGSWFADGSHSTPAPRRA